MAECPGKKSWPELVGKNEENAAAKIEQENHGVRAIVLLAGPGYWKGLQPPGTEGAIGSGSGLMNAASSLGFLVLVRRAIRRESTSDIIFRSPYKTMHAMKLLMLILLIIFTAKLPSDHVAAAARPLGCTMKPKTYVPKTAFLPQARGSVPPTGPNPCIP
ncbi:hypothetical protein ACFXTH_035827 [Malus domestica]